MAEAPTFIVLEGLLYEAGSFEPRRGYETAHVEPAVRFGGNDAGVEVVLVNATGEVLSRTEPLVHFPEGCFGDAGTPGVGLVRAAAAHHPDARRVELRRAGRVVHAADVAASRPEARAELAGADEEVVRVAVKAGDADSITIVARLAGGGEAIPASRRDGDHLALDLRSLEGLGSAALVVEVSAGFRTTRLAVGEVELPPATVTGRIIEPGPDATWPFGRRGSLIGNLSDRNGRRLDWDQQEVVWLIDGDEHGEAQITAWEPRREGRHIVAIARRIEGGQFEIVDERSVLVAPQTSEQEAYEVLMRARDAN